MSTHTLLVIAIGLGAALFIAIGFVLQQHVAALEPADERLSFRLLAHLVRKPLWLAGIASMIVGQLLGAYALSVGSLALVEPVMASNLLFALPLAALWHRRPICRRDWAGAAAVLVGLSTFVAAGDPYGGTTAGVGWRSWVESFGAIAAVVVVLVLGGRRIRPTSEPVRLAAAAGILFGVQDALTQRTELVAGGGLLHLVTTWPVFLLVTVGIVGLLLNQSAFEAGPLSRSLPAVVAGEPVTGIALGVGIYREHLTLAFPWILFEVAGLVIMGWGVLRLAASPVVAPPARVAAGR